MERSAHARAYWDLGMRYCRLWGPGEPSLEPKPGMSLREWGPWWKQSVGVYRSGTQTIYARDPAAAALVDSLNEYGPYIEQEIDPPTLIDHLMGYL